MNPKHTALYFRNIWAAERRYPGPEVRGSGQEELPHATVRSHSLEEQPHIRGKEQWLHFAGAAVKRDPASKVRETQVRR